MSTAAEFERLAIDTWSVQGMRSRYWCDTVSTPVLLLTAGVQYGGFDVVRSFHVRASVDMAKAAGVSAATGTRH